MMSDLQSKLLICFSWFGICWFLEQKGAKLNSDTKVPELSALNKLIHVSGENNAGTE